MLFKKAVEAVGKSRQTPLRGELLARSLSGIRQDDFEYIPVEIVERYLNSN